MGALLGAVGAIGGWLATAFARFMLWFYPPAFRREMGHQFLADVRRRAGEFEGATAPFRMGFWLIRLGASLVTNAWAAWRERPAHGAVTSSSGSVSWLDIKLGLRMLLKSPGLTLAGGAGIAVAIAVGAGFFTFAYAHFYPTIPLPEGDRLVGLENWDLAINNE